MSEFFRDSIPVTDSDPWTNDAIRSARTTDGLIRELGPVVWMKQHECFFIGQHKSAQAVLMNWKVFSSRGRPFDDEQSLVPRILVTEDPPEHSRSREALMKILSPEAIRNLAAEFTRQAERLVGEWLDKGELDGVQDLAADYILKVFPDMLGLPEHERAKVLKFGEAAFNGAGPRNKILADSIQQAFPAFDWIQHNCSREAVAPNGLAAQIYQLADDGIVNETEAQFLVNTMLGAGFDTTMVSIGNSLHALASAPEQWDILHKNQDAVKGAFEETLRYDPPARMMGRIVNSDIQIEGHQLQAGDLVGIFLNAAGRDPRRWENPDVYDIQRKGPHLGFGIGVHSCAGQALARLEFECLFRVLTRRVKRVEIIGESERLLNNNIQGWRLVPLRLHAA